MDKYIIDIGKKAKDASQDLALMKVENRNAILDDICEQLVRNKEEIFEANKIDIDNGIANGLTKALIDRLTINESRLEGMVDGLRLIAKFQDPLGKRLGGWKHANGMDITRVSVPIGVIGMIYESRPNVTIDVAGLSIKSGNCVILRGGSEAIESNKVLASIIRKAIEARGENPNIVQLIEKTDRSLVKTFVTMNDYLDVLIPRGGRGLKKAIKASATVPIIETGEGLCHTYIDKHADSTMAKEIILNAKAQRTGVCNAMETLLIHKDFEKEQISIIGDFLLDAGVEIRACENSKPYLKDSILAVEEDWSTEYLDYILSIKMVDGIDEAIKHINTYGSGHSEAIVTESYSSSEEFLNKVNASSVYVNASTRFTDGGVFGFGGEIGISTQKLHARGPMGVDALTTYKYIIRGNGQIR